MGLSQDLGTVAGFTSLTQGAVTDLATLFGVNPADWDIREATYKGGRTTAREVKFHVFKNTGPFNLQSSTAWNGALSRISDSGGRRKVRYQFPYTDGQTTDDLGRMAESFELEVVIFGSNYMECYNALMVEFNDPVAGVFVHPVRGEISCVADKYVVTHSCEQRKALGLHVTFIEHTFNLSAAADLGSKNGLKAALSLALGVFSTINAAINKVNASLLLVKGIKSLINSYLAVYSSASASTLTKMNLTFNAKDGSADIPGLLPVNLGGTSTATTSTGQAVGSGTSAGGTVTSAPSSVSTSNFPVVASINDPLNGVPVATLTNPTALAVAVTQLKAEVADLTTQASVILKAIEDNGAALELFDVTIGIRQTIAQIQNVLRVGIATSSANLIAYKTPRLMSLREVCFVNKLSPDRVQDVGQLNLGLLSTNYIPAGTVIMVPSK